MTAVANDSRPSLLIPAGPQAGLPGRACGRASDSEGAARARRGGTVSPSHGSYLTLTLDSLECCWRNADADTTDLALQPSKFLLAVMAFMR